MNYSSVIVDQTFNKVRGAAQLIGGSISSVIQEKFVIFCPMNRRQLPDLSRHHLH